MKIDIKIPSSYQRGEGALKNLGSFCQKRGDRILIIGGKKALGAAQDQIIVSLKEFDLDIVGIEWYGGECTRVNINNLSQLALQKKANLIISVGGGKSLDTGKAVAYKTDLPCITIPTIAATCAAFTPLSIVYDEQGVFLENSSKSACPIGVFVDVEIILEAPAKWLFAGMGDTLAKWYELRATTSNIPKSSWTLGGINNGKICYEIVKEFGPGAKKAMDKNKLNNDFEYVIDAIIFYAGMSSILGGEKCRGAASHSIYFGFTKLPNAHDLGHGLLVGFGNLCLLVLEERNREEILEEMQLAKDCGVPISLKEITDLSEDDLETIGKFSANATDMNNMPFIVTSDMVIKAIKFIDQLAIDNF